MSKCGRILMESAYYHIMARGNQKQQVFLEEGDFEKYLALLKHYKRKYKFKLYAWCLMPNHVHLVLEINNTAQLAKIMQGISLAYVRWFNKKYGKVGHLWQGRYKSLAMQKNEYVLDCINYIETNPIRANIKGRISDYKWSSNRARTLGEMPSLLDPLKF
ncbi:MAG: transposase [Candidatus Omnitrophota bacterium]